MIKLRCKWCNEKNDLYVKYHDSEWGIPVYDDKLLFELLVLESFQSGLSWEIILNKRESFRQAFDNFDYEIISGYDDNKIAQLVNNKDIVRNGRKIKATVKNAKAFINIKSQWGSFAKYIWHFTDNKTIYENDKTCSELSDLISADLKSFVMSFVGTTVVYSYLQAIGVIYSHEDNCYLYKKAP